LSFLIYLVTGRFEVVNADTIHCIREVNSIPAMLNSYHYSKYGKDERARKDAKCFSRNYKSNNKS
jgi:hypothetical protein